MKKVGILTLPLHENYGGILQAVALYFFLADKGYKVVSLKKTSLPPKWKRPVIFLLERIPFQNIKGHRTRYLRKQRHRVFINKYMPNQTSNLNNREDFEKVGAEENFDALIVGSDQVWRWNYIRNDYGIYFLDFVNSGKTLKIAYAASFGEDRWQAPEMESEITKMLSDFHSVSVREKDGIRICQEMKRDDCQHVLDPTLLVPYSFYEQLLAAYPKVGDSHMLVTYVLDRSPIKEEFTERMLNHLGKEYAHCDLGLSSDHTVPEWLAAFRDADFVITDSFHGMILAIIFNKQFVVLPNHHRGLSRFVSLLEMLSLEERLLSDENQFSDVSSICLDNKIDFSQINLRLEKLRKHSSDFLLDSIGV